LQESLIRFSRFLQDNDAKRARAEKKAADEIRLRLAKEKEVEQLTEVLEALREEKEGVTEVLDKFMRWAPGVGGWEGGWDGWGGWVGRWMDGRIAPTECLRVGG
jgi:hypothetical protein